MVKKQSSRRRKRIPSGVRAKKNVFSELRKLFRIYLLLLIPGFIAMVLLQKNLQTNSSVLSETATQSPVLVGSAVRGTVYIDYNANGRKDSQDIGYKGVVVYLTKYNNSSKSSSISCKTSTDTNGEYICGIKQLTNVSYTVTAKTPVGSKVTTKNNVKVTNLNMRYNFGFTKPNRSLTPSPKVGTTSGTPTGYYNTSPTPTPKFGGGTTGYTGSPTPSY